MTREGPAVSQPDAEPVTDAMIAEIESDLLLFKEHLPHVHQSSKIAGWLRALLAEREKLQGSVRIATVQQEAFEKIANTAHEQYQKRLEELCPANTKQRANEIAVGGHCRYCEGSDNDPRLKCAGDIDDTRDEIMEFVVRSRREGWDACKETARLVARGSNYADPFTAKGSRQLYWKGRCDASEEIRAMEPKDGM